ncbi:MAG: beta-N-acetylhexosaminidase [Luteolibacter sp.]|nr:beta-N-acetylhexosaminidase [Luteolibacter sp.]
MSRHLVVVAGLSLWISVFDAGATEPALCPRPVQFTAKSGEFAVTRNTTISYSAPTAEAAARFLAEIWRPTSGLPLPVQPNDGTIRFASTRSEKLPAGGYLLQVSPTGIVVLASDAAGYFHAVQTLRQLAPSADLQNIPCVEIRDTPRFGWRGLMLDESRHFMGKSAVFKILDAMASLKLNRFHWHLTDSPGWRLEIKRFPELTTIGATGDQSNPTRPPQFYAQSEIREILAYARARHILVIPEIELPAHATAAMRAYPRLSCTGKPEFMYCAGNDEAIRFLEQVLDETIALFDSPFIHIGGDECPKQIWKDCKKCQARKTANGLKNEDELQSWMVRHFDTYLAKKSRRLIGWDSIFEGGLPPGAAVMSYLRANGARDAAATGHDVVMATHIPLYLDYPQTEAPDGYTYYRVRVNSCERILSFNPVAGIPEENQKHILGLQGSLWSETVNDGKEAEWKLFPRAAAIAELAWSPAAKISWPDFNTRLPAIRTRLKAMGLHVSPTAEPAWYQTAGAWKTGEPTETWTAHEWDITKNIHEPATYKARFIYTGGKHQLQIRNPTLLENNKEITTDARQGAAGANPSIFDFSLALPAPTPGATYTLRAEIRSDGGNDSNGTICVFPAKIEDR